MIILQKKLPEESCSIGTDTKGTGRQWAHLHNNNCFIMLSTYSTVVGVKQIDISDSYLF